jgi:8-amino-7-oxononanoate synthase
MSLDGYLSAQLTALREKGLFRDPGDAGGRAEVARRASALGVEFLDASSNDYLGLGRESGLTPGSTVSRETVPLGAGASRLVQGTHPEHERLEQELAEWVHLEAALLFTSGYAANVGALSALATAESIIISDSLNHASLIDGCRLGRGQVAIVPHRSLAAVEAALAGHRGAAVRWVVTETYFSMDGDTANLAALRALCDRHRAFLLVDEAHALGVFGPSGAGLCAQAQIKPDVLVGTLGKAVGAQGAFVAGSETLRTFLWNRARSFVFSTGTSPALATATRDQVRRARRADDLRVHLEALCGRFRARLAESGVPIVRDSVGPLVPVLVGSNARAMKLAHLLREAGILAQPIRSPTVPEGFERLRITLTAGMTRAAVERLAEEIDRCWRALDQANSN